jgi:hypothetical protein
MLVHPADFLERFSTQFERPTEIVRIVYDNIDLLYDPSVHSSYINNWVLGLFGMMSASDDKFLKMRSLLGVYKTTVIPVIFDPFGTPIIEVIPESTQRYSSRENTQAFNLLLANHGIEFTEFKANEISDAEHFCVAAVMASVPIIGLPIGVLLSVSWELGANQILALYNDIETLKKNGILKYIKRLIKECQKNFGQLLGIDFAGLIYGFVTMVVYPLDKENSKVRKIEAAIKHVFELAAEEVMGYVPYPDVY